MRPLLSLVLAGVLVSGCSSARDTVGNVSDCAALAKDVAQTGLSGIPTQAEADQAVQRLDARVEKLGEGEVRTAATELRDRVRELQEAVRAGDPAAVRKAAAGARDAARDTASACGLPADQFLG